MITPERLIPYGFTENEAKVYLALLTKNSCPASSIIKELAVHRSIVYDNLEKLEKKKLIRVTGQKPRLYTCRSPRQISINCKAEKELLVKQQKEAQEITQEMQKFLVDTTTNHKVQIFKGTNSVKRVFEKIVSGTYHVAHFIGITNESVDAFGIEWWNKFNEKVIAVNLKEYILVNHDYDEKTTLTENGQNEMRVIPEELSQKTEICLFGEHVAIVAFGHVPVCVLIEDKDVHNAYKAQFDYIWGKSKEIN